MPTTLFISDLHLDVVRPQIIEAFDELLAGEARDADALYILGDLFEAWIGDDDDSQLATRVATSLHNLSACGVPIFFMAGNRDFLLGETYAARCGMRLLDDGSTVDLYGNLNLLMHGDTLCTDDVDYQRFRAQVHDPLWQRDFLALPLAERRAFAAQARAASQAHTGSASEVIMDVNASAVTRAMCNANVRYLIHGHTHRPAVHSIELDGAPAERIVLGDWYEQASVLRITPQQRQLSLI